MRYGVVSEYKNMEVLAELGFDYIEVFVTWLAELSDEEFEALYEKNKTAPIKIEAACVLAPKELALTGDNVDPVAQEAYVDKVFARMERLGVGPVVFGSAGARMVPDGFDRAKAWHQLVTFGRMIAAKAAKHGLTIVMEALNTPECNMINSHLEALALVEDVDRTDSFVMHTDFFHLALEHEGREEVAACKGLLRHAHIANPVGRVAMRFEDEADYDGFFAGMKDAGYCERLSAEGNLGDYRENLPEALKVMRFYAEKYGL